MSIFGELEIEVKYGGFGGLGRVYHFSDGVGKVEGNVVKQRQVRFFL